MKKWQKLWITLLASSLAIGSIAQGEATVIKFDINEAQPLKVVIVDSNGKISEQTVQYNPSIGGIDIDTSWAGPNASIYIPNLGIGYIWNNGFWVDREGNYWSGTQRAQVSNIPQWKEQWRQYWQAHRPEDWKERLKEKAESLEKGLKEKAHGWKERAENWWQQRGEEQQGQGWQGHGGESANPSGTPGAMPPSSSEGWQSGEMRSTAPQGGYPNEGMSDSFRSGQ